MSLRRKRKPDAAKLNLVSSRSNSIHISRLSIPVLPSPITSTSCSLDDSQNISQEQSGIATDADVDTDTVIEDVDNYLPGDTDRHSSSTRSHRTRQVNLADRWSSVRESILDGMVQSAALPSNTAWWKCFSIVFSVWSTCLFLYIVC